MEVMRGVAATPGSAVPGWGEVPEPGPPPRGAVLCRTLELGICGTDREILESRAPQPPPGERFLVLGHECVAEVLDVGADAEGLAPGDLVVPVVRRAAPDQVTRVDLLPPGAYTERGIVAEHGFTLPLWHDEPRHLFRVDPGLRPFAVLTEPLAVAEKAINEALLLQRARFGAEAWTETAPRVLVTGLGPIAFAGALAALVRGWPTTLCGRDSPDTRRVAIALRLGAEYLPQDRAFFERLSAQHEAARAEGYDLLLECTGSDEVLVSAAAAMAPGAVLVWLGGSYRAPRRAHDLAGLMLDSVLRNHLHLGCVNAAPRDFRDALRHLDQWARRDAPALASLVTQRACPQEALPLFAERPRGSIKSVLDYASA